MSFESAELNEQQREVCAICVMRMMLEDYCVDTNISFSDAFYKFVSSRAYKELFDYETGIWREGPDYLRSIFLESMEKSENDTEMVENISLK